RVARALQPADVLEEIWTRDVVDLVWETFRLRRLKAQLMAVAAHEGLAQVLEPAVGAVDGGQLARGWAACRADAVDKVETMLASAGFTRDHVAARTLSVRLARFSGLHRPLLAVHGAPRRHPPAPPTPPRAPATRPLPPAAGAPPPPGAGRGSPPHPRRPATRAPRGRPRPRKARGKPPQRAAQHRPAHGGRQGAGGAQSAPAR